jgi:hypothetical protein
MFTLILLLPLLFSNLSFASNDWNTPCFHGECYHESPIGAVKIVRLISALEIFMLISFLISGAPPMPSPISPPQEVGQSWTVIQQPLRKTFASFVTILLPAFISTMVLDPPENSFVYPKTYHLFLILFSSDFL